MPSKSALTLIFATPRGEALVLHGEKEIVLHDGRMKVDGVDVAVHENNQWVAQNAKFSRFDIEQAVDLHLRTNSDTSRTFGPYAHFSCMDGVVYVEQRIFAFYDEQNRDWYVFDDGRHWKALLITAASRR
jgi:hypothetical protein